MSDERRKQVDTIRDALREAKLDLKAFHDGATVRLIDNAEIALTNLDAAVEAAVAEKEARIKWLEELSQVRAGVISKKDTELDSLRASLAEKGAEIADLRATILRLTQEPYDDGD